MFSHQSKIYIAITVILLAVILLGLAIFNIFSQKQELIVQKEQVINTESLRHTLSGEALNESDNDFFSIAVMIDNSYDVRPQYGLSQAEIIYEALSEANITRLMAIFDSHKSIEKIGPVRSARPYFMDWAREYGGVYMHVGGSPTALASIGDYSFYNIDQIGSGEIYFWRDNNLNAPHNVFTSSSNWLRVGEVKEIDNIDQTIVWSYTDFPENYPADRNYMPPLNFSVDFSVDAYKVDWKFNKNLNLYQRWQGGDKHIYDSGEQIAVKNVIVQVVEAKVIDDLGRRSMKTEAGGRAWLINPLGLQIGTWIYENGRTRFYDETGQPMQLVPGKTWVEIVPGEESLILN